MFSGFYSNAECRRKPCPRAVLNRVGQCLRGLLQTHVPMLWIYVTYSLLSNRNINCYMLLFFHSFTLFFFQIYTLKTMTNFNLLLYSLLLSNFITKSFLSGLFNNKTGVVCLDIHQRPLSIKTVTVLFCISNFCLIDP